MSVVAPRADRSVRGLVNAPPLVERRAGRWRPWADRPRPLRVAVFTDVDTEATSIDPSGRSSRMLDERLRDQGGPSAGRRPGAVGRGKRRREAPRRARGGLRDFSARSVLAALSRGRRPRLTALAPRRRRRRAAGIILRSDAPRVGLGGALLSDLELASGTRGSSARSSAGRGS
jgi:hypothetical protein